MIDGLVTNARTFIADTMKEIERYQKIVAMDELNILTLQKETLN